MSGRDITFTAHFTGSGIDAVDKMTTKEIYYWAVESYKLHKEMNKSE